MSSSFPPGPIDIAVMSSPECSTKTQSIDSMAVPATSPTSCYAGTGTTEELEQKVMESASSVLKIMKDRRTAQASTGKITKGTHPTSTVPELHERQINTTESEELVTLRERLVFRSNVPIPADSLFLLQQSYKDAEALINKYLASNAETTPLAREILGEAVLECPDEDKIILRCALREFHEASVLCLPIRNVDS